MEIRKTAVFAEWFDGLRDRSVRVRIQARIDRLGAGNAGQHRNLSGGVSELKVDVGPGYRVYFTRRGDVLIVLLCGGDKSTQQRDIQAAIDLAAQLE